MNPPNLSVVCVDNGHYGETGYQKSHTSLGVDLEKIAAGSGIKRTLTIEKEAEIAAGARLIREGNAASFVLLRVKPTEPPSYKRDLDPATTRTRFRAANMRAGGERTSCAEAGSPLPSIARLTLGRRCGRIAA